MTPAGAPASAPASGFDIQRFTLAELAELEAIVGVPFDQLSRAPSRARMMAGLLLIKRRRTDPGVTLDDVMGATMEEIADELGTEAEPDPLPTSPAEASAM